jgi:PleD family two-component response regulator
MELMGGSIGVESVVVGSTFWIELPLPTMLRDDNSKEPGGEAIRDFSIASRRKIVLYVEDNLSNLRLVESILTRHPHLKLLAAMQGTLGLELARLQKPDLILLDLHLPDIGGDEVLRRLQAEARRAIFLL